MIVGRRGKKKKKRYGGEWRRTLLRRGPHVPKSPAIPDDLGMPHIYCSGELFSPLFLFRCRNGNDAARQPDSLFGSPKTLVNLPSFPIRRLYAHLSSQFNFIHGAQKTHSLYIEYCTWSKIRRAKSTTTKKSQKP